MLAAIKRLAKAHIRLLASQPEAFVCWEDGIFCANQAKEAGNRILQRFVDEIERLQESEEAAWGLIANAYGGNWDQATDTWRAAAERWRDSR